MKYLIYAALLFIASLLFLPESGSTEIRNPEILWVIAAVILLVLIIRFLKLTKLAGSLKKSLKENKYQVLSTRFGFGKVYVTAESHRETLDICLLRRKKDYLKHHFASTERIELYKTTVSAVRSGRDIAKVSKYSEVKHAGNIRILPPKDNSAKRVIVFDKFPTVISDYANRSLQIGDKIAESEIAVFDMKAFVEYIK
jgi:hypothetical protein